MKNNMEIKKMIAELTEIAKKYPQETAAAFKRITEEQKTAQQAEKKK